MLHEVKLLFIILASILQHCNGLGIDLFTERNYVGTIQFGSAYNTGWTESPTSCYNFPSSVSRELTSIKANGHCIIIYSATRCSGNSIKIEEDVPNLADVVGNLTQDNFDDMAMSLKECTKTEGGSVVNVDLYKQPGYQGSTTTLKNICRCNAFPQDQVNVSSINNHHHCIQLYSSNGCDSNAEFMQTIHPGLGSVSENLTSLPIFGKIRSYRPCSAPPECMKLNANIYSYKVYEKSNTTVEPKPLDMAATSRFYNNGSATVTQQYTAKTKLKEVIEIGKIEMERRVTTWSMKTSNFKGEYDVLTAGLGSKLSQGVKDAYGGSCDQGQIKTETYITEENSEFTTTQTIEVPPCSYYDVSASMKVIENYPLEYTAYIELTGEFAGNPMTADELKEEVSYMPHYTFDHEVNKNTIAVNASSYILVSFGAEAEIIGTGGKIPNCFTS